MKEVLDRWLNKRLEKVLREGWTLDRLVARVCEIVKVDPDDLRKKGRESDLSRAQGLIAYWVSRIRDTWECVNSIVRYLKTGTF